jgi:hypothetical protein
MKCRFLATPFNLYVMSAVLEYLVSGIALHFYALTFPRLLKCWSKGNIGLRVNAKAYHPRGDDCLGLYCAFFLELMILMMSLEGAQAIPDLARRACRCSDSSFGGFS